jgi:hypothetical protein
MVYSKFVEVDSSDYTVTAKHVDCLVSILDNSLVGIPTRAQTERSGFGISAGTRYFSLRNNQPYIQWVPPSSFEVMNECNYTSAPPLPPPHVRS